MKFKDKFKPGDIICSDRFHNGLCMVVDKLELSSVGVRLGTETYRYRCEDLVKEGQKWSAYENVFEFSYDWRIATDDDIANYLSRFINIPLGLVGDWYLAKLTDDGIMLEDRMFTDKDIYFDVKELVDLKRIINETVG